MVDGQQLQYDWLVLALGSSTSFFGIPGVKDLALPFNDFKDAMRVTPPSLLAQQVSQHLFTHSAFMVCMLGTNTCHTVGQHSI